MIKIRSRLKLFLGLGFIGAVIAFAYFYLPQILGDVAYPLEHADIIRAEAERSGVPADLIAAMILKESSFNEDSVSSAGAVGLMQLMPGTARGVVKRNNIGEAFDLRNPTFSIVVGTTHVKELFDRYSYLSEENRIKAMLVAYNAGAGVGDYYVAVGLSDRSISPGVRSYIKKVLHYRDVYRQMYAEELGIKEKLAFQNLASAPKTTASTFWLDLFSRTINLKI